jgi:hypothetical protein
VVRTTGHQVKNFKPRQGVGSNVTFDDLSDGGFHASRKAFTEGREKSESQKDFTEGNKGNKGCDLRPFAYLRFLLLVLSAHGSL